MNNFNIIYKNNKIFNKIYNQLYLQLINYIQKCKIQIV